MFGPLACILTNHLFASETHSYIWKREDKLTHSYMLHFGHCYTVPCVVLVPCKNVLRAGTLSFIFKSTVMLGT